MKVNKFLNNDYFLLVLRIILGAVFLFASIEKIADPEKFAFSILNYRLIPEFLINLFAITLPWIELIAGLFLVFGIKTYESNFILLSLIIIFTIAIFIALVRGLDIECGCFGTLMAEQIGMQKILENVFLILISVIIGMSKESKYSLKTELLG